MANPKVMTGARALVYSGPNLIGTISNLSYNVAYDTQDAYLLGRLSAAEIGYVAVEPVTGSLSGFEVLDNGPHVIGLPAVGDLLTADYTTIVVVDRNTNKRVAKIKGLKFTGRSGGKSARQFAEYGMPFKALLFSDETVDNAEPSGSNDLP
jgi:hypothetical protein